MATRNWTILANQSQHSICLVHTYFGGKREIWLDGALIESSRKWFDYGSRHVFQIGGLDYEIAITTNGLTFNYFLLKGNLPIPSDQDRQKGKTAGDLLQSRYLNDLPFWQELGQVSGLDYRPRPGKAGMGAWRHRLIGMLDGYLVQIQYGMLQGLYRDGWSVIVRHRKVISSEAENKIHSDNRIQTLLGNLKKSKVAFEHTPTHTWILLPKRKRESSAELAGRVQVFLKVVTEHAGPLLEGVCESEHCRQPLVRDRQLVWINAMPWLFCQDCITDIPGWGKQAEAHYQQLPGNLGRGLAAGAGVAFLGSLAWAAAVLYYEPLAPLIAILTLDLIVRAMEKVKTKRTLLSLSLGTILAFGSLTAGYFFTGLWYLFRQEARITLPALQEALQQTFADPDALNLSLFLTLIWAIYLIWLGMSRLKQDLSWVTEPDVEVLPGNY